LTFVRLLLKTVDKLALQITQQISKCVETNLHHLCSRNVVHSSQVASEYSQLKAILEGY